MGVSQAGVGMVAVVTVVAVGMVTVVTAMSEARRCSSSPSPSTAIKKIMAFLESHKCMVLVSIGLLTRLRLLIELEVTVRDLPQ